MLESAVQPVKALIHIEDKDNQLKMHNKKNLSYDDYSALVEAAAANFDTKFKVNSKRPSRAAYQKEIFEDNDADSDSEYDVDLPISSIQANFTKTSKERVPSESFSPAEKWKALTPESRETWEMLPNDMSTIMSEKRW